MTNIKMLLVPFVTMMLTIGSAAADESYSAQEIAKLPSDKVLIIRQYCVEM